MKPVRQLKGLKPPSSVHWFTFSWGSLFIRTKDERHQVRRLIRMFYEEGQVVSCRKNGDGRLLVYHRFPTLEDYY